MSAANTKGLAQGPVMRRRRSALRKAIAAGTTTATAILTGQDMAGEDVARGMRVDDLLRCTPGVGDETIEMVCGQAGAAPHKRVGALPIQTRAALAAALEEAIA